MTVDSDLDDRRREAASWFARLNQKRVAATDITDFSQWRRQPENAAAYARIETLWEAADTLGGDIDVKAMTEAARGRADKARRARSRLSRVYIPIGAVVVTTGLLVGASLWSGRSLSYETALGEHRIVILADGSRVTLDTASRVRVKLGEHRRSVTIVNGQAFFEVKGDPSRPFVVTAGDTDVTAVGTRFDVRKVGEGARVTLVEGKVDVRDGSDQGARWSLTPGQQVVTAASRPEIKAVDARTATSWTSGRLIFSGDTIGAAVSEVNRYSETKVVLEAPAVANIPVSGAFNTGDVDGFVSALTELYPVRAERISSGQIVIHDKAEKKKP